MKDKSLLEFAKKAASGEPVPGGGSVSAACGALAASLASMVTNLTIGKKKYLEYTEELESIKEDADKLRNDFLDCIDEDAKAFYPLSKAYSYDKSEPNYFQNIEICLRQAAEPPLKMMRLCNRIIELDARLAVIGSKLSVSDAGTSVMLAYGALYGAYTNVLVNARLMNDKEYACNLEDEARELLLIEDLAKDTYNKVLERL